MRVRMMFVSLLFAGLGLAPASARAGLYCPNGDQVLLSSSGTLLSSYSICGGSNSPVAATFFTGDGFQCLTYNDGHQHLIGSVNSPYDFWNHTTDAGAISALTQPLFQALRPASLTAASLQTTGSSTGGDCGSGLDYPLYLSIATNL